MDSILSTDLELLRVAWIASGRMQVSRDSRSPSS